MQSAMIDVSQADSGVAGAGAIPVVRMEVLSREGEPPREALSMRPGTRRASVDADLEASKMDRAEPDPRLTRTLDPEESARRLE